MAVLFFAPTFRHFCVSGSSFSRLAPEGEDRIIFARRASPSDSCAQTILSSRRAAHPRLDVPEIALPAGEISPPNLWQRISSAEAPSVLLVPPRAPTDRGGRPRPEPWFQPNRQCSHDR